MGKSYKKHAVCGNTLAESEKQDKRRANRKFRRIARVKINIGQEPPIYIIEVSNFWDFSKDGRHFFSSNEHPHLLRK